MAVKQYTLSIRDSTQGGLRKTGLTPTWVYLVKTSDYATAAPQPTITEISSGHGQYHFSYDAGTNGEAAGQIDCGSSLTNEADRYIDVYLAV